MKKQSKGWTRTAPQVHGNLVRLRFRHKDAKNTHQGVFSWSDAESAFVECVEGPDNIALYQDEGWRIISWQPFK